MSTVAEEISNLGRMIEGHLTNAEYEEYRERLRFLKECKEKGFKRLEKLGTKMGGINLKPSKAPRKKQVQQMTNDQRLELLKEMVKRVKDGETLAAICAEYEVHTSTVYGWAKRLGIEIPTSRFFLSYDLQQRVIEGINEKGMSLDGACKKFGGSPQGIKDAIKKRGLTYNPKKRRIEDATA